MMGRAISTQRFDPCKSLLSRLPVSVSQLSLGDGRRPVRHKDDVISKVTVNASCGAGQGRLCVPSARHESHLNASVRPRSSASGSRKAPVPSGGGTTRLEYPCFKPLFMTRFANSSHDVSSTMSNLCGSTALAWFDVLSAEQLTDASRHKPRKWLMISVLAGETRKDRLDPQEICDTQARRRDRRHLQGS